jgi:hypothetical protein
MSRSTIPQNEWHEFLRAFNDRHAGWLVSIETHDLETGETVTSRFLPLQFVELDLEDEKNPRVNVTVRDGPREIKRVLFRPSEVTVKLSDDRTEEGLRVVSLNTVTTVRFRVPAPTELIDDVA